MSAQHVGSQARFLSLNSAEDLEYPLLRSPEVSTQRICLSPVDALLWNGSHRICVVVLAVCKYPSIGEGSSKVGSDFQRFLFLTKFPQCVNSENSKEQLVPETENVPIAECIWFRMKPYAYYSVTVYSKQISGSYDLVDLMSAERVYHLLLRHLLRVWDVDNCGFLIFELR